MKSRVFVGKVPTLVGGTQISIYAEDKRFGIVPVVGVMGENETTVSGFTTPIVEPKSK